MCVYNFFIKKIDLKIKIEIIYKWIEIKLFSDVLNFITTLIN